MTGNAELEGKVAVVTGGASGIGLGLAIRAAREGMRVALADVEEEPLQAALEQVRTHGAKAIAVRTDVSDPVAVQALAEKVEAELGAPWLICNNAGVNKFKKLWEFTQADWQWILGVNLWGVINGISSFVPGLVARNAGYVVNTSSAAGLYATPGAGAYVTSKHALVGLSECLYRELRRIGSAVGVSVLCPKLVATNMMTATRNEPGVQDKPAPIDMTKVQLPVTGEKVDVKTPDMIGDEVILAIAERRFWILPHADSMRNTVINRFTQAIHGENPDGSSEDQLSALLSSKRAGLVAPP